VEGLVKKGELVSVQKALELWSSFEQIK